MLSLLPHHCDCPELEVTVELPYVSFMETTFEVIKVCEGGRIVIPVSIRRALKLQTGQDLLLAFDGESISLLTRAQGVNRAQEIVRKYVRGTPSLVDELIAERHAEAARE